MAATSPAAYDSAVKGLSAHFVWLNRGKRSIVLDLKDPLGRQAFDALLDRADVFVHNQGPGAAERLGCQVRRTCIAESAA